MITRAQAEALLTLAESLEACERVGVTVSDSYDGIRVETVPEGRTLTWQTGADFTGKSIRTAVADLMPKHTGS